MRLGRWLALVGLMVGMGALRVAQRNAVFLKGYAVGERVRRVHAQETEVAWLNAEVEALQSPMHLARVAQERHLKLVAWSPLAARASARASVANSASLVHLAAGDSARTEAIDDTAD